jgi:hypothetical protein
MSDAEREVVECLGWCLGWTREEEEEEERERDHRGEASSPTSLRLVSDRTARSLELIVAPQILQ